LLGSVISTLELFCSAQPATISNAAIETCVKKVLFIGYLLFVITIYVGRSVYVRLAMNSVKLHSFGFLNCSYATLDVLNIVQVSLLLKY